MFRRRRPAVRTGEYPCPCCGRLVHSELPRDYEVCPVCGWEVNPDQLRWPDFRDGPNGTGNLLEQQEAFQARVAEAKERGEELPGSELPVDPGWRPIDLSIDSFELCGVQERPWPEDQTLLYWWRPTFWRRDSADADEAQARMLWRSLRAALHNLGLPAAAQIELVGPLGSHDDLALDFENVHSASWQARDRGWISAAVDADMNQIDELLDEMSGRPDRWTDEALVAAEVWARVRDMAGRCLTRMPVEPWRVP